MFALIGSFPLNPAGLVIWHHHCTADSNTECFLSETTANLGEIQCLDFTHPGKHALNTQLRVW